MVSPSQRRRAADMIQDRLGLSQRRACQIVGQHRSTQRHRPAEPDPDRDLRRQLRDFARHHPRWGYRRAHAVLCREGHHLNRKKVQRLWREEGLRVPPRRHKRPTARGLDDARRPTVCHPSQPRLGPRLPVRRDSQGRNSRSSTSPTSSRGSRSPTSSPTRSTPIARSQSSTSSSSSEVAPQFIRCDNGPELTANALSDWCDFSGAGASYIEPGSPWQNPWVESYGSRMREELLSIEQFDTLLEARVLVADWKEEYNTYRPHSALGMLTPAEFAARWRDRRPLQLT